MEVAITMLALLVAHYVLVLIQERDYEGMRERLIKVETERELERKRYLDRIATLNDGIRDEQENT
jgi:hypothetical protein